MEWGQQVSDFYKRNKMTLWFLSRMELCFWLQISFTVPIAPIFSFVQIFFCGGGFTLRFLLRGRGFRDVMTYSLGGFLKGRGLSRLAVVGVVWLRCHLWAWFGAVIGARRWSVIFVAPVVRHFALSCTFPCSPSSFVARPVLVGRVFF